MTTRASAAASVTALLLATLVLSALTTAAAGSARAADDRADDELEATPGERHWYGWPLLISDTASLVIARFALEGSDSSSGLMIAGATYALVPGAVHLIHGNPKLALASVGVRISLPLLGAALMSDVSDCGSDSSFGCGYADPYIGFMLGASAAIVIDHLMSIDRHAPPRDPRHVRSTRRPPAIEVAPTLAVTPRGGALGLLGRF